MKETPAVIELTVNGEQRRFEEAPTVAQLLEQLELAGKRVALERNGEIVPRSRFGAQRLADGDRLEIVVAVGGG
jgi:sulfur carrier protein